MVRITNQFIHSPLENRKGIQGEKKDRKRQGMRWFAHAYDMCLYALLAVRRGMPFLLSGTRPECSSVCLLGLSWWWQLHAGQVRWVRNTNALLKRLNTRKWILIYRFAESQLASVWGWRHIGPPNQSKYKTASAILQTAVVTLKSCLRVTETKRDVFKLQCLYVFGAREPTEPHLNASHLGYQL